MTKIAETYFDPETEDPLHLVFQEHTTIKDNILIEMSGVPLLKNGKNKKIYFPIMTFHMVNYWISEAKKRNNQHIRLSPKKIEKRFSYLEEYKFKYSSIDYEYIPGLVREWNEGFLTPVFFNIAVLNKYSQHPEYTLEIFSETYGTIRKGDDWDIQFGINRSKKVIIWLGDISSLPESDIYYLRSENIDSDHDIHSEFYDAQIGAIFSEPSTQDSIFRKRSDLNRVITGNYGFPLYILDGEISETLKNVTRPVFWEEKHIAPVIESLNRIIVESINIGGIKSYLSKVNNQKDIKSKKGLKLYQIWLEEFFTSDQAYNIMSPFFILYDFRVLLSHLQSNETKTETLSSIKDRLKLPPESNLELIYDSLLLSLLDSYSKILEEISSSGE